MTSIRLLRGIAWVALLLPQLAHAQDRTSVFVVGDTPDAAKLAALVRAQIEERGGQVAMPQTYPAPAPLTTEALATIRGMGTTAIRELAKASAGEDLLAKYAEGIQAALGQVSAATTAEARDILWNTCVLNLRLHLLRGDPVEEVARECRRHFPKQYEFSHAWAPEVMRAFQEATQDLDTVALDIKSSPAGCDVLVYGSSMGKTPVRLTLQRGRQVVQLRCNGELSRLHEMDLNAQAWLTIRLEGDRAFTGERLVYADATNNHALDHATALAAEADAKDLVLVTPDRGGWHLRWASSDGRLLGSRKVAASASSSQIALLFTDPNPTTTAPAAALRIDRAEPVKRMWQDYTLGASLIAAGIGAAVRPIWLMAAEGECGDAACTNTYSVEPMDLVLVGASTALLAAGSAVIWVAPFGRRQDSGVRVGMDTRGIRVRGTF